MIILHSHMLIYSTHNYNYFAHYSSQTFRFVSYTANVIVLFKKNFFDKKPSTEL